MLASYQLCLWNVIAKLDSPQTFSAACSGMPQTRNPQVRLQPLLAHGQRPAAKAVVVPRHGRHR
jgi:hypothetical protein